MDRPYDAVIGHALTATDHCERLLLTGQAILRLWEVILRKMTSLTEYITIDT